MEEAVPLSALGAERVCPAPGSKCGIPIIYVAQQRLNAPEYMHFGLGSHVRPKNGVPGGTRNVKTSPFVEAASLP